jgi:hypothetical protein
MIGEIYATQPNGETFIEYYWSWLMLFN